MLKKKSSKLKDIKNWRHNIETSKQTKYNKFKYTKILYSIANQNIYFIILILLTKQI